ncbi:hypothetical protein LTR85_011551 [Meristemomyces frigidus]|nr:hypothetical protein LTR85_011551 [Meristemomyces frigidus]
MTMATLSNWAQSRTDTPMFWQLLRNCWPLLTLPEAGAEEVPLPTVTLLPLAAAMLASCAQSAIDMPLLVQLLENCWPLLMVGVAEALEVVLEAVVKEAILVDAVVEVEDERLVVVEVELGKEEEDDLVELVIEEEDDLVDDVMEEDDDVVDDVMEEEDDLVDE